jgi:hypothetical protein
VSPTDKVGEDNRRYANYLASSRPLSLLEVDQIKRHGAESQKHIYTLLLVPRTSTLITRVLEEEGVLGDITISAYNLQFIPIADDVISLENGEAFKEIWVVGWTFLLRHCSCESPDSGWRRDLYL